MPSNNVMQTGLLPWHTSIFTELRESWINARDKSIQRRDIEAMDIEKRPSKNP
jgi:hypothetical protein